MAWTPTEGMKRANLLMVDIEGDLALGQLAPMARAMMFNRIADALDQALADGQFHDARAKVIGANGNGAHPVDWHEANLHRTFPLETAPATADPIGFDPVIEAHEEGPGAHGAKVGDRLTIQNGLHAGDYSVGEAVSEPSADAPKKKRGRPKGSKAKKAKPAKAKAAKPEVVVDNTGGADYAVATADPASEPTIDLVQ